MEVVIEGKQLAKLESSVGSNRKETQYKLGTVVNSINYDFKNRCGRLMLPKYMCSDATGAIGLFLKLDRDCKRVEVYADWWLINVYELIKEPIRGTSTRTRLSNRYTRKWILSLNSDEPVFRR